MKSILRWMKCFGYPQHEAQSALHPSGATQLRREQRGSVRSVAREGDFKIPLSGLTPFARRRSPFARSLSSLKGVKHGVCTALLHPSGATQLRREQRGLDCSEHSCDEEWGILKSLSPVSLRSSADDLPLPVRYAH